MCFMLFVYSVLNFMSCLETFHCNICVIISYISTKYSISYKKTDKPDYKCDYKWLRVTTRDYQWLRVTMSDYEWLQATRIDYEWLRARLQVTTSEKEWLQAITSEAKNDYNWDWQ